MYIKQLVIVLTSCSLVACAASTEQDEVRADEGTRGGNDCIHEPSIRGYVVLDEQNLIVEASGRRQYHVVLRRRAHGIRSSHAIAFDASTSRVCAGFDSIRYDDDMAGDFGRVRIMSIQELSEEEEEYLLIQYGKKEPEIKHTPAPQDVEGAEVEELDEAASE